MTYAEHAIENAVYAIEQAARKTKNGENTYEYDAYEDWKNTDPNLEMLKATPEEICDMAMWVIYNRCGYCDYYREDNNND